MSDQKNIYLGYINSIKWAEKRNVTRSFYERNGWKIKCVKCNKERDLILHHNYYMPNFQLDCANLSDLDFLCKECHSEWHKLCEGWLQNKNLIANYNFYLSNKDYDERCDFINLLGNKVREDEKEIMPHFSDDSVIEYEKEAKRVSIVKSWCNLISFFLLFLYGIGIIGYILTFFLVNNSKTKPEKFNDFFEKRKSLAFKKNFIKNYQNPK